jgi:hypothetical protein
MIIQDPVSSSMVVHRDVDYHNSTPGYEQEQKERLNSLAARENTVIDNPYQSSHINNNWTRNSMKIQALHSSFV